MMQHKPVVINVNNSSITMYLKDNQTIPLYSFKDILKMIFREEKDTLYYINSIPSEHRQKVDIGYSKLWCIDYIGLDIILRRHCNDDRYNILFKIKEETDKEYSKLSNPAPKEYFSKNVKRINLDHCLITCCKILDHIYFKLSDLKLWNNNIESNDIVRIRSKYESFESYISSDTLIDILFKLDILEEYDRIIDIYEQELEIDKKWNMDNYPNFSVIVDGDNSNTECYHIVSTRVRNHVIRVAVVNLNDSMFFFFNIKDICKLKNIDYNVAEKAAVYHSSIFFKTSNNISDIYASLFGISDILNHFKKSDHDLVVALAKSLKDIKQKVHFECTGHLIYSMRYDVKVQEEEVMRPIDLKNGLVIVAIDQMTVRNEKLTILLCIDQNNEHHILFIANEIGKIAEVNDVVKKVKRYVDEKEKVKTNLTVLNKNGVVIITIEGIKQLLTNIGRTDMSLITDLEHEIFELLKYRQKGIEQMETNTMYTLTDDKHYVDDIDNVHHYIQEITELNDGVVESFPYKGNNIDVYVTVQDNTTVIYYEAESLCKACSLEYSSVLPFARYSYNNKVYVSLFDMKDTFTNTNEDLKVLFEASKNAYDLATNNLLKKYVPKDRMITLLQSNDPCEYILGAVLLAEKFRNVILWLDIHSKTKYRAPGPKNNILLNTLWNYIDYQDNNAKISFGFKKQVEIVIARYEQLLDIVSYEKKNK